MIRPFYGSEDSGKEQEQFQVESFIMADGFEAIYEGGVLRPLQPLNLPESHRVRLTISEIGTGNSQRDLRAVERARAELATTEEIPSIEEVRRILQKLPGCLSHDVIADRDDS